MTVTAFCCFPKAESLVLPEISFRVRARVSPRRNCFASRGEGDRMVVSCHPLSPKTLVKTVNFYLGVWERKGCSCEWKVTQSFLTWRNEIVVVGVSVIK